MDRIPQTTAAAVALVAVASAPRPLSVGRIVFFNRLDLYRKLPDSGESQCNSTI